MESYTWYTSTERARELVASRAGAETDHYQVLVQSIIKNNLVCGTGSAATRSCLMACLDSPSA
jgi:hypothetical protein